MASLNIPIIGGIWPGMAEMVYDYLDFAKQYDPTLDTVEMPIMSNGGSAVDGLRGYAALKDSGLNIRTKAPGGCDSAATLYFAAGNVRQSTKAAIFLCHNPYSCGYTVNGVGTADDHQATADELRTLENQYAAIYAASSSMPIEHWKGIMAANKSITAQQAFEWGFVTELTDSMPIEVDAKASNFMAANNAERLTIMSNKNGSKVDALLARFGFGPKAEVVAESVALEGGGTLEVTGSLTVGATTTAEVGEYTTTDGQVVSVGGNPDGEGNIISGIETADEAEARRASAAAAAEMQIDVETEALVEAVVARVKASFDAERALLAGQIAALTAEKAAAEAKLAEANARPRAPWPKTLPPVTGGENTNAEPQAQKKIVVNADGSSQSTLKRK